MRIESFDEGGINYILVGNPGVGKSTILNGMVGAAEFESGISLFGGLTSELGTHTYKGNTYLDTPGLSDVDLRDAAAQAIQQAMKKGGKFKILFVVTLEAGRLRPDDLTTIRLVTESCDDIPEENGFAIVINKLGEATMKMLAQQQREFLTKVNSQLPKRTTRLHLVKHKDELFEAENVAWNLDETLKGFVEAVPVVKIDPAHVHDIKVDEMEEIKAQMAEKMSELESNAETLQKEMARQQQEFDRMMTQTRKENVEAVRRQQEEMKRMQESMQQGMKEQNEEFRRREEEARKEQERMGEEQKKLREKHQQDIKDMMAQADQKSAEQIRQLQEEQEKKYEMEKKRLEEREKQTEERLEKAQKEHKLQMEKMQQQFEEATKEHQEALARSQEQARQSSDGNIFALIGNVLDEVVIPLIPVLLGDKSSTVTKAPEV